MERIEERIALDSALSDALRDNVAEYLTGGPYDLQLGSETTTTTVETEICTATYPQRCHTTEIEIPSEGWEWNDDNPFGSLDWSGVHTGPKNGVLISPDILVSATHMGSMQIFGRPITFHSPDGESYDRDAVAYIDVPGSGDIRINLLNEPLPDDIHTVALPDPRFSLDDLYDTLILSLTWEDTSHVNKVRVGRNDQNVPYIVGRADAEYVELFEAPSGGDSGSGIFFIDEGSLVVASTLHNGTRRTLSGPYLGSPEIQQGITEAIDQLGGQQRPMG